MSQFFKRIGFEGFAGRKNVFDFHTVSIAAVFINESTFGGRNHEEELIFLSQIGFCKNVAAFGLIHVAFAVTVYINAGVLAEFEACCASLRIAGREQLDPAHLS